MPKSRLWAWSRKRRSLFAAVLACSILPLFAESGPVRERVSMDANWRFALGNAVDSKKDFGFDGGEAFFWGKAGHGNGPAAASFDDRSWLKVQVPHDWAVALPFDSRGDGNHGSKAIGHNFPENSVGWYRRTFTVAKAKEGRRFRIDFDGVYRDSQVWLNGFYLGTEHSGYSSFGYDMTNYLNYGGDNVLVVRANATTDEGWFYEGAGIYRHVWLTETSPIHVAHDGVLVTTDVKAPLAEHPSAGVQVTVDVENDVDLPGKTAVQAQVIDSAGHVVSSTSAEIATLPHGLRAVSLPLMGIADAKLWSLEKPTLYTLVTSVQQDGKTLDRIETPFGLRTVRFDPDHGFFLNERHVLIKGTNDHQDHAGVGVALPDDLNIFRIERLKALGSNAIRTSHNPPSPALLDAADRMGMLILDENRMMGTTAEDVDQLTRMVVRDRNHPSVILWSIGNEEWALEWSAVGERMTHDLQALVKRLDPTRRSTVALSGSGGGNSLSTDVFGFNYYMQHKIDRMHERFPQRPIVGTEESSSEHTRGIYRDDPQHQHLVGFDFEADGKHASLEDAWRYYMARPYTAGLFYWTGFDYRGEPTPFGWPAISSQFGILDTCGFMKDTSYLVQSLWLAKPMVHLAAHWAGRDGERIDIPVYTNTGSVELFLNGKSLGRKAIAAGAHGNWQVPYAPGKLLAVGYNGAGIEIARDVQETTSKPAAIVLEGSVKTLKADGTSVSVVTVGVRDAAGREVSDASNPVAFEIRGPGRLIGVGNGDPSSHEADQFLPRASVIAVHGWRMKAGTPDSAQSELSTGFDDAVWERTRDPRWDETPSPMPASAIYRANFEMPRGTTLGRLTLLFHTVGEDQTISVNGHVIAAGVNDDKARSEYGIDPKLLVGGENLLAVTFKAFSKDHARGLDWNWHRGGPASIAVLTPAAPWKRSVFSGLAQVLVQSTGGVGPIILTATSAGLKQGTLLVTADSIDKVGSQRP